VIFHGVGEVGIYLFPLPTEKSFKDRLLSRNPSMASLSVLEGPLSLSPPGSPLLSSLGSLPVSLLQSLMRSQFFLAAFRVHLPAPFP